MAANEVFYLAGAIPFFCPHPPPPGVFMISLSPFRALTGPLAGKNRQRLFRWQTGAGAGPEDSKMVLSATGGRHIFNSLPDASDVRGYSHFIN